MSSPQKGYRVYGYDGARKIVTSDWIDASNDEDAIAHATSLGFTRSELWLEDRLIAALGEDRRSA
jgi:hypothetical protein